MNEERERLYELIQMVPDIHVERAIKLLELLVDFSTYESMNEHTQDEPGQDLM